MKLQSSLKIAFNIIFHSKLRSWLTVIGIVIGVAAIISIVSIGNGFQKDFQKQLGNLGSDIISITSGFDRASECPGPRCRQRPGETAKGSITNPLTNKEVQVLKSIPEIQLINTIVSDNAKIYYLGKTTTLSIDGVDINVWKSITTSSAETGRLLGPGDDNVVVVGNSVANDIFKNKISINRELVVNDKSYRVVGVLKKSGGFGFDDRKIFMPINSARKILNKKDNVYDSVVIKVKNSDEIDKIEKLIENKLMTVRHVNADTKDFTVLSMKTIQERVSAIIAGFTLFLGVIAAVSLIVGAVGIANTMFTSVLERTRDIGIMKAVGAKNSDILLIFLFNSGLVGLVGGLLGIMFGIGISLIIPKLGVSFVQGGQSITTSIDPQLIIFTLIFSIVLGMLSGIIPAYRASKLKPVDALRSE